jgi:hypothetical protein
MNCAYKYSLINNKNYNLVSKYLDDACFSIDGFSPITESEYYEGYELLEKHFRELGVLCNNGDFSSDASFITDRFALDPSRRLFVMCKSISPMIIKKSLAIQQELNESFVIIIIEVGFVIILVSKDCILVYINDESSVITEKIKHIFS